MGLTIKAIVGHGDHVTAKLLAFLSALLLCALSFAGHYHVKSVYSGNPSGGEYQYVDLLEGSSGIVPYVNDPNGNGYGGGHNSLEGGSVECRGEIFLTGQKVRASLNFTSPGSQSAPSEFTFGSWQWAIPTAGMPFKDYVAGNYSGVKHELTAGDLDNPTFEFYTVDNGEIEQELSFNIAPVGSTTLLGTGEVTVKSRKTESVRPELESYEAGLGSVNVHTYGPNTVLELAGSLGPSGAGSGIRVRDIKYKVEHFELKGYGAVAQLITPSRQLTVQNFDGTTTLYTMDYSGMEGLDHSFPYKFDDQWTLPALGSFRDSPGLNLSHLPNTIIGSANDSFKTWLMYRPLSNDSMPTCWIPISMFTWMWTGTVDKRPKWTFTTRNQQISQWTANALDHPLWNFFFQPGLFDFSPL